MSKVCVSCGLTLDTDGRLIVNTGGAVWPYACAEAAGGSTLYCNPATGVLHGGPTVKVDAVLAFDSSSFADTNVPGVFTTIVTTSNPTVNPSSCAEALMIRGFEFEVTFTVPVNNKVQVRFAGDTYWIYHNTGTIPAVDIKCQLSRSMLPAIVAAGAADAGTANLEIVSTGSGTATYSAWQWNARTAYVSAGA